MAKTTHYEDLLVNARLATQLADKLEDASRGASREQPTELNLASLAYHAIRTGDHLMAELLRREITRKHAGADDAAQEVLEVGGEAIGPGAIEDMVRSIMRSFPIERDDSRTPPKASTSPTVEGESAYPADHSQVLYVHGLLGEAGRSVVPTVISLWSPADQDAAANWAQATIDDPKSDHPKPEILCQVFLEDLDLTAAEDRGALLRMVDVYGGEKFRWDSTMWAGVIEWASAVVRFDRGDGELDQIPTCPAMMLPEPDTYRAITKACSVAGGVNNAALLETFADDDPGAALALAALLEVGCLTYDSSARGDESVRLVATDVEATIEDLDEVALRIASRQPPKDDDSAVEPSLEDEPPITEAEDDSVPIDATTAANATAILEDAEAAIAEADKLPDEPPKPPEMPPDPLVDDVEEESPPVDELPDDEDLEAREDYTAGADAFNAGLPFEDNPHPPPTGDDEQAGSAPFTGTPFVTWNAGWLAAQAAAEEES